MIQAYRQAADRGARLLPPKKRPISNELQVERLNSERQREQHPSGLGRRGTLELSRGRRCPGWKYVAEKVLTLLGAIRF